MTQPFDLSRLEAGPETDRLVAKSLGWKKTAFGWETPIDAIHTRTGISDLELPHWSTSLPVAIELWEKILAYDSGAILRNAKGPCCISQHFEVHADTWPLALCRAWLTVCKKGAK